MNFEKDMRDLSLLLCTISLVAGFISCDNVKMNQGRSNGFENGGQNYPQTVEILDQQEKPVFNTMPSRREKSRIEADNSLVETMFDNHGNKTESRFFNNNPVLKMVILRTTAAGETKAIVYGQNGDIKIAPPEIAGNIMKASAKEIAKAADISEGKIENEIPAMIAAQKPTPEISPLSNSENASPEIKEPVIKTENLIQSEMLSDRIIKSENTKQSPGEDEVKPYDIPQN